MLDSLWNDVRFAARTLRKDWGFSSVAILTLALAIGANTAIFSVVDAVILRPLGYPAGDRLYAVHENVPKFAHLAPLIPVNAMHFREWVKNARSLEQMALLSGSNMSLTGAGDPERIAAARATPSLFPLLGAQAQLGRVLLAGDDRDGQDRVAVLDAALWRNRFGADPNIVGRKIVLDDAPYEVVGVLPDGFHFPQLSHLYALQISEERPLIWRPFVIRQDESPVGDFNYAAVARLKQSASPKQAVSEMDAILNGIFEKEPEKIEVHAVLVPLQEQITGRSRAGLQLMLAAVAAVLLIGCVNIANLMLARAANRRREVAIRRAVGASGARLFGQVLVEGLTLSGVGGLLGVGVAWATLRVILANLPADLPRADEIHLDLRVLLFTMSITIAAGLLFALLPAWRFTQTGPQEALRSGGRGSTSGRSSGRLRSMLVGAEVGLSAICLIAGGLLLHSFVKLLRVDRGFQSERVVTVDISLPSRRYPDDAKTADFLRALLRRARALPGVVSVGLSNKLPLSGEGGTNVVLLEGQSLPTAERPLVDFREVSSDYFQTLGIPLRQGKVFEERDGPRKEVMVSEEAAARLWPGQNPLGRRFRLFGDDAALLEVTGVVGGVRGASLSETPRMAVYLPYWQRSVRRATLAVRTAKAPESAVPAIRQLIHESDAELPVPAFQTMDEIVAGSVAARRFQMNLVLLFAGAALLLASLGIYGVVSYTVTQRTNEIGIRMALGAQPGRIRAMVLRQGLLPVMAGLLAGVTASLALTRVLSSLLFGVGPRDPATIGGVAAVLTAMAVAAILLPARRAMRVAPSEALRYE
jgi:predicted permease